VSSARIFAYLALTVSLAGCLAASVWEVVNFSIYNKAYDFNYYRNDAMHAYLHGWAAYYSSGDHTIGPPLQGLVMFPFLFIDPNLGFVIWTALSLGALALIWWLATSRQWWLLPLLAVLFPIVYTLLLGQIVVFVGAAVVLGWWLASRGHPLAGGIVLSLATIKPQLILLLPLVLLLAGHRRLFVGFCLGTLSLLALSFGLVGPTGVADALANQQYILSHPHNNYLIKNMILTLWLGLWPGLALSALLAGLTGWLAWRARHSPLGIAFAIGLLGSLLVSPYLHPQDLTLWVVAGLFMVRFAWLPPLLSALGLFATWSWISLTDTLFAAVVPNFAWVPFVPLVSLLGLVVLAVSLLRLPPRGVPPALAS
jgi:hypothetical protein